METVTDLLTKFFGPGDYENTPLGTNPFMFESIQGYLAGKLDTIEYPNPGLSDPEYVTVDRGILVKAFGLASLFASVLVVVIRLLTRSFLSAGGPVRRASDEEVKRKWWKFWPWWLGRLRFGSIGWDDWAMIPTLILLGGYTAVNVLGVTHGGMGKHVYDATLKQVRFLLKVGSRALLSPPTAD